RPRRARRTRRGSRPEDGSLRPRPPSGRSAARLRAGRVLAPAAPRPALRRRPHGLVPVLRAAGRGGAPSAGALRPGGRLARDTEPRLLARVPRPRRRRGRSGGAAPLRARAATGVLFLAAARAAPARRGTALR